MVNLLWGERVRWQESSYFQGVAPDQIMYRSETSTPQMRIKHWYALKYRIKTRRQWRTTIVQSASTISARFFGKLKYSTCHFTIIWCSCWWVAFFFTLSFLHIFMSSSMRDDKSAFSTYIFSQFASTIVYGEEMVWHVIFTARDVSSLRLDANSLYLRGDNSIYRY